ncbi:hypothetical protein [Occallatibacter riparius]|uniref:Uncharacterized protein n=1 Tax=Occallatibacter riparius TaxID=1002689 RepID=A0A9J7BSP3_9BACT|nr:hypothetical protein [Occallatibacter riparius]UWZ84045.1 hypothetical protein MOP44_26240 [Occallatibacter riparius]
MPFDRQLIEAKLAVARIDPAEMPGLAWDALEEGLDGPAIRRLAALDRPSGWQADQVMPAFMAEAGLKQISVQEASIRLARHRASQVLLEGLDPLAHSNEFYMLWIDSGHVRVLQDAGCLNDEIAIGQKREAELSEYARTVLEELVKSPD